MTPKMDTATARPIPCATAIPTSPTAPLESASARIAPAPRVKKKNVPATSAARARVVGVTRGIICSRSEMTDFRPSEGRKAQLLAIKNAPPGTTPEHANVEWVELMATEDGDLANWRLMHVRPKWVEDVVRPVAWEWVFTF